MPRIDLRQIRVDGQLAYVPLSQGLEAVVDICDLDVVSGRNWYASGAAKNKYAVSWMMIDGKRNLMGMHRHILNAPIGVDVDHIDGNGLNNRRSNIRLASRSQNMHNKRMQKNNTSGFKGVHWDKNKKKWQANIKLNDKRHYLGLFDTAEQAAEAYRLAAINLHVDFYRLR